MNNSKGVVPNSEHYENALLCINNGKPVLCEKAFTVNAGEAEKLKNGVSYELKPTD